MYLVDLPGYGYTKIAESEKRKWGVMVEKYLHLSEENVKILSCAFKFKPVWIAFTCFCTWLRFNLSDFVAIITGSNP